MGLDTVRRALLDRLVERAALWKYRGATPGSAEWLIRTEAQYGGYVAGVRRRRVSPRDTRTAAELRVGGMVGGDRMSDRHHGFAARYAEHLAPFVDAAAPRRVTVVEVGILKGTGLAIWSDLFPRGRIVGLDIDLSHARANMPALERRGAFRHRNVELHEFDQFEDNAARLAGILQSDRIDVMIDDGQHSDTAILTTLRSVRPHFAPRFVYFAEDNSQVHRAIRATHPDLRVLPYGLLTVCLPA